MRAFIDIEKMKTYTLGNDVLVKKLLQSFIDNMPEQLQQLKQAANTGNLPIVHGLAHKLKTPFLYVGVTFVADKLGAIENDYSTMPKNILVDEVELILNIGLDCVEEAKQLIEKNN